MTKTVIGVLFFFFSFSLISCSSIPGLKRSPNIRFVDLTLAKGVDERTIPAVAVNSSTTFSIKDEEVVAFLKLQNLSGRHTLKWDWYSPDSTLYYSTGNCAIQSADGKIHKEITAWHRISIRGEKAAKHRGTWVVNIFLDNELVTSRKFKME